VVGRDRYLRESPKFGYETGTSPAQATYIQFARQ
jgi:hypothetical protein